MLLKSGKDVNWSNQSDNKMNMHMVSVCSVRAGTQTCGGYALSYVVEASE